MCSPHRRLDFTDLLFWTARLLRDCHDVRTKLATRCHHLLIDEFQVGALARGLHLLSRL